jgi:hypothetical protein
MDGTRMSRSELQLQFGGNKLLGRLRIRWSSKVQADIKNRGKVWQDIEKGQTEKDMLGRVVA